MRIILATFGNGYCGCDQEDVFFFEDNESDTEINSIVYSDWVLDMAESYAYVHFGWDESYTDEDYDDYIENYVSFGWDDISVEKYLEVCEDHGWEPRYDLLNEGE